MSAQQPQPAQPQPPTATTTTFTPITTNDNNNNNRGNGGGRGNNPDGAPAYGGFETGGFIYVILIGAMLVALVYFGRAILAKRRERIRRLKDPDFEANPPNYMSHLHDLAVIDASDLRQEQQEQQASSSGGQNRPRSTSSSNVSIINAPPAALIRGNGNGPDGDVVSYYLITPRVLHEHQRQQQQRHARSSSSPSAATIFAQGYGQGERGRRSRTRTETHSSPPHPRGRDTSGAPFVPMILSIPPLDPSEPQPPAYEDLSPREERMNTSPSVANTTSMDTDRSTRMSVTPPRIDSLPVGATTTPTPTTAPVHYT
ncbi:hypothetical protein BG015_004756 [Linnemannia schmuckeri]|uniref:Uncharacterized protein n=1 Tax=Linnemannia schmuckeri TaxID=64567 RepID=A0A9P5R9J9_9FUNG|nr:hypothetical protein BG015_004756 [Linnemannia schmuckeri]